IAVQQRQVDGVKAQIKQHDGAVQSLLKEGVVVDNRDAKVVGVWKNSTFSPQFVGAEYIHDEKKGKGDKRVTFTADLPAPGEYEVRISYTAGNGRAKKVPLRIEHADGSADVFVDQTAAPELANLFHVVGRYRFASRATVTLSNAGTTGHVIADAVQFVSTEKGRDKSANDDDGVELAALRGRLVELEKQLAGLKKEAPQKPRALAVRDAKQIADCELRIRGEHGNRGAVVPRGFLQVIPIGAQPSFGASESGRRELADWLADHRNPLTSRVFANRVWARLMGRGVVPSVDNFGTLGQTPTHPQLLDALAGELISADGSVKRLVREIVCSRAYRSSSADVAAARRIDPENELLWRAHRKRLEAEAIRDAMLLVSGQLDETRAASPVEHLGVLVTTNRPDAENYQQKSSTRRTVFLPIIRNELPAMLTAFDFADPDFSTGQRAATSTPTQSLLLLNSPFVKQCAAATASRWAERGHDLDRIYLTLLSRHPLPDERAATREFIKGETAHGVQVDVAWRRLIHAIIASAEFRILE
ncbi:MAG: DUF1553 domain-containing protein, partial [Pirellulaceae bacterium]|nr:DUF1553 domain-containing protein [Pirellulaceae bacterium]